MEPTIVYLATKGSYSDYRVLGVFTTREKAQERLDANKTEVYADDGSIEEFHLDQNGYLPGHLKFAHVRMSRNGETMEIKVEPYGYLSEDSWFGDQKSERWFHMMARDTEHAIKIANERRTQLIADNKWVI